MKLQKTELSIFIEEKDLLQVLFDKYRTQIEDAGITSGSSLIRNFTIDNDGKCVFRICAMILLDEPIVEISNRPLESEVIPPSSIRIRKSKKDSNNP